MDEHSQHHKDETLVNLQKDIGPLIEHIKNHAPQWAELASDSNYEPFNADTALAKARFFEKTLRTGSTVKWWIGFRKIKCTEKQAEIKLIMEVGNGVTKGQNLAHNGFLGSVIDEAMGIVNKQIDKRKSFFTAYLNLTFKRHTPTPSVLLCHVWINKEEGRKRLTYATLYDEKGNELVNSEGLFLVTKSSL
eukprot:Phypoly_transcript_20664.p1 GENE.Phypoly_transcript_20664~~Phypoly_transcript_20664.p1  ORF type:complete len:191 (+),score=16.29 Phypoly_transcript_20664:46-618(+)